MTIPKILVTSGAALALVAGGTAAGAAIAGPTDSSGVIHACYTVTFDSISECPTGMTITLAGPTGDQFDVLSNLADPPISTGGTSATETAGGQYFIHVNGATSDVAGDFTLQVMVT